MAVKVKAKTLEERWDRLVQRIKAEHAIGLGEPEAERQARINRARVDYDFFVTYYFPHYTRNKLDEVSHCAPFHIDAANAILANPMIAGFLQWFRGSAKSTHCNIFIPLWLKIQAPIRQLNVMLLLGRTEKAATRLIQDIQVELAHNERYIHDFGPQIKDGSWKEGEFQTVDGCAFVALGMGQAPRGTRFGANRPDYITGDDLDNIKMAKNPARVTEAVEWIHRDVIPTMDIGIGRFLMVNNLIVKKGIMATMMALHPDWFTSKVNALDENGEVTWKKYTKEFFAGLLKKIGFKAFQSEYMNDPQADGGVFTNEQIQWKKMPNDWTWFDSLVTYCDPSYSTGEASDYTAIALWGKKGERFYKLKVYFRQRETIDKAIKWWFKYYLALPVKVRAKMRSYIEANATQCTILRPILNKQARKTGIANFIQFDKTKKGDKADRIGSMTTQYANGDVYYNVDEEADPDMIASIEQLTAWTEGAKHDDGPDADESAWRRLEKIGRASGRSTVPTGGFTQNSSRAF
jgi:predicted phage terminase large subunit-like protein